MRKTMLDIYRGMEQFWYSFDHASMLAGIAIGIAFMLLMTAK